MKICDDLRQAVLQAAIQGKLTTQRPEDGDARELLKQIAAEKAKLIKEKKIKKEKPLPEITEEEIPFEVPDNWVWVRFQDCCRTLTCGYASTPKYVSQEDGKPFLSAKNIKPYRFMPERHNYIEKDLYDKLRTTCKPEKDDILLTRVGAGIGEAAIIDTDLEFAIYVSLTLIKLVNNRLLYNKYILYWLNSPIGIEAAHKNTYGKNASQGNLNVNNVRNYLVPIPPFAEQHRIVNKVEKLMAEIDELEKVENELHALKTAFPGDMKSALLQAAMQGKLTTQRKEDGDARDLLKQIAKEKAQLIKEKKIKKEKPLPEITEDEIPFDVPENWVWCRLGEISTYNQTKQKVSAEQADSNMWLLDLEDIEKGGRLLTKKRVCETNAKGDKTLFYKGNILYSKLRPYLLKVLEVESDGICTPELIPFSMYGGINNAYIISFLKSPYVDYIINSVTYGAKMPRVGTDTMINLCVPLPPLAEQHRIVAKLEKLLPLCDGLVEE